MTWKNISREGILGYNVETCSSQSFCFCGVLIFSLFQLVEKGQAAANLTDIPSSSATEINYLIGKEIINGYGDGTFRPTSKRNSC